MADTYAEAPRPTAMVSAADGRHLVKAVGNGSLFPNEQQLAHCPNESVSVDSLLKAGAINARALSALTLAAE